jgi:hypothetical protein
LEATFLDHNIEPVFNFLNDYFQTLDLENLEKISKLLKFYSAEKSNAIMDEASHFAI